LRQVSIQVLIQALNTHGIGHVESAGNDAELQPEVERLRTLHADTKSLYQAVAAAMFFRFRLVPTANRMHVLVGKGSMTTASAALARFWQDVRRAARPAVEHPDLPPELARRAGELVVQLWAMARAGAAAAPNPPPLSAADDGGADSVAMAELTRELAQIRLLLGPGTGGRRGTARPGPDRKREEDDR
jgi:plasmid replication DNA-binding protein KfrA